MNENLKTYLKHCLMWSAFIPIFLGVISGPLLIAGLTGNLWWLLIYLFETIGILAFISSQV